MRGAHDRFAGGLTKADSQLLLIPACPNKTVLYLFCSDFLDIQPSFWKKGTYKRVCATANPSKVKQMKGGHC